MTSLAETSVTPNQIKIEGYAFIGIHRKKGGYAGMKEYKKVFLHDIESKYLSILQGDLGK